MNFPKKKKLIKLIVFTVIVHIIVNCNKNNYIIIEISNGIKVSKNFIYSNESKFKINDTIYILQNKAYYNKNGNLEKIIVFKSEGILTYNKNDLAKDKKIIEYYKFPQKINLKTFKNLEKINLKNNEIIFFKSKTNGITTFYKINKTN